MRTQGTVILGAGVTGLAAGIKTGAPILEANAYPGGICYSYTKNGYHFESGGGHWLFGTDKKTLNFIRSLAHFKSYRRNSAVFFPKDNLYIPYPLQAHLSFLPKKIALKALNELREHDKRRPPEMPTFSDWLKSSFGETLCQLFFFPYNKAYTDNLYTKIAPQDVFKNPIGQKTGYNQIFIYPTKGLSYLIGKMAQECQINLNKKVVDIETQNKKISFADKTISKYKTIISTLPLNKMVQLTRLKINEPSPPYTSAIVTNIGAEKGKKCPPYHWLYLPQTKSGFHRVGFYSNVDTLFLPHDKKNRVSLYVETTFQGGDKPKIKTVNQQTSSMIKELQEWQFINKVEVIDPTWIEVAYTWSWPGSNWKEKAIAALEKNDIYQIGRYGRWHFQGILESIKEGLTVSRNFLS